MVSITIWLFAYIALLLAISYIVSQKQNEEDYLISGRDRSGWQIMASKFAGAIGAGYFITYTGFAYEYGLGVFAMLLGIIVGYLLFAYWASPKIFKFSHEKKFYTMGDFVKHCTGSYKSLVYTNWLANLILFGWLLVGIIGGAKIISDFGLLSYSTAVIVTSLVVLSYILLAGFKAVIITDVIQGIVILLLLLAVAFSIIGGESVMSLLGSAQTNIDAGNAIGFLIYGLLSLFSFSNFYQLCYAAKDARKLKHGLGLSILPVVIVAFFLLVIGVFMASSTPGLDSGLVFIEALKNFLPAALLPLAVVLFFAGVMSSADTNVYGIASHAALNKKKTAPIRKIRLNVVVLMVLITLLALIFSDIVDVSVITGGLSLTLSVPMIYLLCNGKNARRFIGSSVGSLIFLAIGIGLLGLEPTVIIVTLLGGLLGLLWNFGKMKN